MQVKRIAAAAGVVLIGSLPMAHADDGFYAGIGAGGATLEADLSVNALPASSIDEDDSAFKAFAGYVWERSDFDWGVELSYTDFGEPEVDFGGNQLTLATTGVSVFGVLAYDLGPVDVFGKLGLIQWDTESSLAGLSATTDDTDTAYGIGLSYGIGDFAVRGELEMFDLGDSDLSMLSLGVSYRF